MGSIGMTCRAAWLIALVFCTCVTPAPAERRLVVGDGYNNSVMRYDAATGAFVDVMVPPGSGGLNGPRGLVFGPDGNLYVCSYNTNSIIRYSGTTGALIGDFVAPGSGGLLRPMNLTFGPDGKLYVCSDGNAQVLQYDGSSGESLGTFATDTAGFHSDLAFGPDGNLYLLSYGAHNVTRYNGQTGASMGVFVPTGGGGMLVEPYGLTFGPNGNLYASARATHSVLEYDGSSGAFIGIFTLGSNPVSPIDLEFGPGGDLYVVSYASGSVRRYNGSTGVYMYDFVAPGSGGLVQPWYLAFGPPANIPPVAEAGPDQIVQSAFSAWVTLDGSGSYDPQGLPLTYSWAEDGSEIATDVSPNVQLHHGEHHITLTVTNTIPLSASDDVKVVVDRPPVAFDGTMNAIAGYPARVYCDAYDPDEDEITLHIDTPPSHGAIEQIGWEVTYTADPGYVGSDSLTFHVSDPWLDSNTATMSIAVRAPVPPVADSTTLHIITEVPTPFTLTASDANELPLTYYVDTLPSHGTLTGDAPDLTYTSEPGYTGPDSFTFHVSDPIMSSSAATVSLVVGTAGSRYLVVGDIWDGNVRRYDAQTGAFIDVMVPSGSGGLWDPSGIVFGPDRNLYVSSHPGTILRYHGRTGAFMGVFVPSGSGGLNTPAGLTFGPDANLYVVDQGYPVSAVRRYDGTTGASLGVFASGHLAEATDLAFGPDGNLYVVNSSSSTVARFDGSTGAFIDYFVPAGAGGISYPWSLTFGPDHNLYVSNRDTDSVIRYAPDGTPLGTFASGSGISLPSDLAFGPDGSLYVVSYYTNSVKRFNGATGAYIDDFVAAGFGGLHGPWPLAFSPPAEPPVANAGPDQTVPVGPVSLDGSGSHDPQGLPLDYVWKEGAIEIATGVSPTNVPLAHGYHTITLTVTNTVPLSDSDDTHVLVDRPPVAQGQEAYVIANTPKAISLVATDPDLDPLTYQIVTPPSHGVLSGSGANRTYTPAPNYRGPDSFTFKTNDGWLDSNVATVVIDVGLGLNLNCGGPAVADWVKDRYFSGGRAILKSASISGAGTVPVLVYQAQRSGSFSYTIPARSGQYDVRLHFAEIESYGAGQRLFDVYIGNLRVLTSFDIFAAAGGRNKAIVREFTTTVTGSSLTIRFVPRKISALVAGIEMD